MKMRNTTIAIVLAVVMLAIPFAGIATDATDSTSSTTGTYTVFYNDGTSGWSNQIVSNVFDGAQAVKATSVWQTGDVMVGKNTGGTWASPDTNYGDITTFMGKTETSEKVWNVFVCVDGDWTIGNANIGYYACFDDYYSDWMTANIALYYAAVQSTVPAEFVTYAEDYISDITEVQVGDSAFAVSFYMKNSRSGVIPTITSSAITSSELSNGKVITGYGSTVYLALKQVLGADVSGIDALPGVYNSTYSYWTYNGWIDTIFGLGTNQISGMDTPSDWTDDTYVWWQILDGTSGTGSALSFVLGYYSPLSCSEASLTGLSLVYAEGNM